MIERVGDDVHGLAAGQRVYVSPHMISPENVPEPAEALIGLTAEPGSASLLDSWKDGTLAELMVAPVAAVTPVPTQLNHLPDRVLAAVSRFSVPYGGLLRGRLAAGETVVIHGATGAFGSAGVRVAQAMGAARVVAAGRNPQALDRLAKLDRVTAVELAGELESDAARLRDAAGGGADCALDLIGRAGDATGTLATLAALRRGGRLVLMGSMTVPLPLDNAALLRSNKEIIGNFMYPRAAVARVLAMAAAGQLDLAQVEVRAFPLAELPAAGELAGQRGAPLVVMVTDDEQS